MKYLIHHNFADNSYQIQIEHRNSVSVHSNYDTRLEAILALEDINSPATLEDVNFMINEVKELLK